MEARVFGESCLGPGEMVAMMWWGHGAWGAGDWLVMSLMMVFWLVHTYRGDSSRPSEPSSGAGNADELLAERFARGEIDEEEFRRQRELLHSPPGTC